MSLRRRVVSDVGASPAGSQYEACEIHSASDNRRSAEQGLYADIDFSAIGPTYLSVADVRF